jgi:hypothetical protein
MWYLFQGSIVMAVLAANEHWQIIPYRSYAPAFVGGLLAYAATVAILAATGSLWRRLPR